MIAAIILAVRGHQVNISRPFFSLSQAVLASVVVSSLNHSVLGDIGQHWIVMLFSVFSVIIVSFLSGAVLAWFRVMPGTTALWGSSPGGASTMMLICGSFGADPRLAAFMLYFRVILVALATSLIAWFVTESHHEPYFPPPIKGDRLLTLGLVMITGSIGGRLKFPAAPLLLTMAVGAVLQLSGFLTIAVPQWVRLPAYMIIGWSIGLRFTKPVLQHALRSLPAVAFSSTILVTICALLAFPVARLTHIDLLSAYLATSPGGLDTIIIISAGVKVALPFIIALQTARLLAVLAFGPLIAKPLGLWLETHSRKIKAPHPNEKQKSE